MAIDVFASTKYTLIRLLDNINKWNVRLNWKLRAFTIIYNLHTEINQLIHAYMGEKQNLIRNFLHICHGFHMFSFVPINYFI